MPSVAVLFSGGKDSTRTVHWCLENGYNVKYLVTIVSEREDSYMYHVPNIHLTDQLSKAIGIPLVKKISSGIKEKEVEDVKDILEGLDIDAVACGGIASNYQKSRIEKVCKELSLNLIAPFWGVNPEEFMRNTIKLDFDVRFIGVYSMGMDKTWLGRKLDEESLKDLIKLNEKYEVNLVGEGGEFETLCVNGPIFKKKLEITDSEIIWDEGTKSGWLKVKKAKLI
ncbi:MAG: TIGR00289 family protein [Candidatus Aenigmarchaeota archaeon]|nr:TIGR00289 family protein [Candidatus Aenigmarchaeota archaeon]